MINVYKDNIRSGEIAITAWQQNGYAEFQKLGKETDLIMKKPMTTAEYFQLICGILREEKKMPDNILDYALETHEPTPIRTFEFNIRNNLEYGGSEGIYLDVGIEFYENGTKNCKHLGTFKTLHDSAEAMRIMAQLLADFIVEGMNYVNSHSDDFTWTGVDVYPVKEDGTRIGWGLTCRSIESALKHKDELLKKYAAVTIRNNRTRQERCYRKDGKSDVA